VIVIAVTLLCACFAVAGPSLDSAIAEDDVAGVEKFVKADAGALTRADTAGRSPLHRAAKADAKKSAEWLLKNGADFYARDNNHQLPLDVPPGETLNLTRQYLREINKKRNDFLSAVARDDVDAINKMLADDKSLANARDIGDGWSALMMACHFGHLKVLEALLASGAKLDATDFHTGYDAVYACTEKGQAEALKVILKAGADPKKTWRVQYGSLPMEMNAMHVAAWKKHSAVVEVLIAAGLDVNARAKSYAVFSPLHFAATEGDAASVNMLLKAGADKEARDGRRNITALQMAEAGKHEAAATLLRGN
jgi:ankyrin repeat protein